jgi:hypothetical protein
MDGRSVRLIMPRHCACAARLARPGTRLARQLSPVHEPIAVSQCWGQDEQPTERGIGWGRMGGC